MPAAKPLVCRMTRACHLPAPVLLLLLAFLLLPKTLYAQDQPDTGLFRDELEVIRLINVERQAAGLAPLAWNAELTIAARTFARDTVENVQASNCDHVDSRGREPAQRMRDAGYAHLAVSAENSLCGYLSPAAAVAGWMKSPRHRANILDGRLREAGAGYYRNAAGVGQAVLDMASDAGYAPLVIDGEAATASAASVHLYLYDQESGGNWQGVETTVAMMVSNTPDFAGAEWEPYTRERAWTLAPGEGWRTVYVKTRDRLGRTTIVHDSIYQGTRIPDAQLSLDYATQVDAGFTLDPLAGGSYSHIQFSLNWLADDSDENFALLTGPGERVNDAAAIGGNAFRMARGAVSTTATDWNTSPFGGQSGVAYFRLKVDDNSTAQQVATLVVGDGAADVAVRRVLANEFAVRGQFQEFAVPFSPSAAGRGLAVLSVASQGSGNLYWDATELYTLPQPISSHFTFRAPGDYYRSSGVAARLLTPGSGSSPYLATSARIEVYAHLSALNGGPSGPGPLLQTTPASLAFSVPSPAGGLLSALAALTCAGCEGEISWVVESDAAWLTAAVQGGQLQVQADPSALAAGIHTATILLSVADRPDIAALHLPVTLLIGRTEILFPNHLFIPAARR